jgi:hypothetical protein
MIRGNVADNNTGAYGYYSKSDNRMIICYNILMSVVNFISALILLFIIGGILLEIYQMVDQGIEYFKGSAPFPEISEAILKIIELLFLCSIPLLITTSFYKYYKRVIRSVFVKSSINERLTMIDTLQSLVDLSMTKYAFFSILISTGFIILLRRFNNFGLSLTRTDIYFYALMLVAIISLLFFTLKIKHGITEGVSTVIKEEREMYEYNESQKFIDQIAELKQQIGILWQEKRKLEKEMDNMKTTTTKSKTISDDEFLGTA